MKLISVYVSDEQYKKLRERVLKDAMKNGKRASMTAFINKLITSYLDQPVIPQDSKEDPPTSKSSEIPSEPLSEQKNNFSFNLNDL